MQISNSNAASADADGYARGQREEHLTNPSVTDRSSSGIAQLATVLGYTYDPVTREGFALRAAFVKGYCRAVTEEREQRAQAETDPDIRQYRMGVVHCGACGCELAPGMSYRNIPPIYCNDCIEEDSALLRD